MRKSRKEHHNNIDKKIVFKILSIFDSSNDQPFIDFGNPFAKAMIFEFASGCESRNV